MAQARRLGARTGTPQQRDPQPPPLQAGRGGRAPGVGRDAREVVVLAAEAGAREVLVAVGPATQAVPRALASRGVPPADLDLDERVAGRLGLPRGDQLGEGEAGALPARDPAAHVVGRAVDARRGGRALEEHPAPAHDGAGRAPAGELLAGPAGQVALDLRGRAGLGRGARGHHDRGPGDDQGEHEGGEQATHRTRVRHSRHTSHRSSGRAPRTSRTRGFGPVRRASLRWRGEHPAVRHRDPRGP